MLYRVLADALVACHFGFVLFVVLGGLLVLRFPRAAWFHLPAAVWGAWVEWTDTLCPLTPLENHLRRRKKSLAPSLRLRSAPSLGEGVLPSRDQPFHGPRTKWRRMPFWRPPNLLQERHLQILVR